jgi:hypothetical protein
MSSAFEGGDLRHLQRGQANRRVTANEHRHRIGDRNPQGRAAVIGVSQRRTRRRVTAQAAAVARTRPPHRPDARQGSSWRASQHRPDAGVGGNEQDDHGGDPHTTATSSAVRPDGDERIEDRGPSLSARYRLRRSRDHRISVRLTPSCRRGHPVSPVPVVLIAGAGARYPARGS